MDMREFVSWCRECDPRVDPERAEELLRAAAELGEAILKNREKNASVPYQQIIDTYNQNCGSLPKATKLTEKIIYSHMFEEARVKSCNAITDALNFKQ